MVFSLRQKRLESILVSDKINYNITVICQLSCIVILAIIYYSIYGEPCIGDLYTSYIEGGYGLILPKTAMPVDRWAVPALVYSPRLIPREV